MSDGPAARGVSRHLTVLGRLVGQGEPVVEHIEETLVSAEAGAEDLIVDRVAHCGCGAAIRTKDQLGGVCTTGHAMCLECAATSCVRCGQRVCRGHRQDWQNHPLCARCARFSVAAAIAAAVVSFLLLGFAAYFFIRP